MARTQITETSVLRDTWKDTSGAVYNTGDNANGMFLADTKKKEGTLLLHCKNTNAATRTVTVKAGSGNDVGPGWRTQLGDLVVTLGASTGEQMLWLTDSARFKQSDGTINIDISGTNVTIAALRLAGI